MKERVLLVVHTTPWDLAEDLGAFVAYYNSQRYHMRHWAMCHPMVYT